MELKNGGGREGGESRGRRTRNGAERARGGRGEETGKKKRCGGYLSGKARKGKESLCAIEREFVPFRSGRN